VVLGWSGLVDRDNALPLRIGDVYDCSARVDAGVVEQAVETICIALEQCVDPRLDVVGGADVEANRYRFAAASLHQLRAWPPQSS
jgi:hypothetical protein